MVPKQINLVILGSGTSEQVQEVRDGGKEIASGKEKRADGVS